MSKRANKRKSNNRNNKKEIKLNELSNTSTKSNSEAKKRELGVIGVPHTGWFNSFTNMAMLNLRIPPNTTIKWHSIGSSLVYDARQKIIDYAIEQNADWVFFMDSDMVLPYDTLLKFTKAKIKIHKDKEEYIYPEILTGMCFKRTPPFQPCFYTKARINPKTMSPDLESPIEFPPEGYMELEGCGMAACFIKMSAINKIKSPYFFPFPGVGEDLSFCIRARKARVRMFVDLSVNVGHVAQMPIFKEHFEEAKKQFFKNNENKDKLFNEGGIV